MPGPHHWRRAPADNGSADPNADVRPGRPAKTVLGAIRGLMSTVAAARDDDIGELVATLGGSATNVYGVTTNEGLIDIATGVNNVPAAITTPFILRLSFDTTLTAATAHAPHLVVDGFDCGPILRGDLSALKDGDLVQGRVVTVLGDMAQPADTKVTRVRVLDRTPSELAAAIATATQPAPAFPNASATLLVTDLNRDLFATGVITLTMPSDATPGWVSGAAANSNPLAGLVTLAVPAGHFLDGVVDGTTVLLPFQSARLRLVAAGFWRTQWVAQRPTIRRFPFGAAVAYWDLPIPAGWSRFRIPISRIYPATNNAGMLAYLSFDGGLTFKSAGGDYVGAYTVSGEAGGPFSEIATGMVISARQYANDATRKAQAEALFDPGEGAERPILISRAGYTNASQAAAVVTYVNQCVTANARPNVLRLAWQYADTGQAQVTMIGEA